MAKTSNAEMKDPTGKLLLPVKSMWSSNPELIREFIERRPHYQNLANKVAQTMKRRLETANIDFSGVTSRAKTLKSFVEKCARKTYAEPLAEITDFAGVRVVCLYIDDLPRIERIIRESFEIVEKIDKLNGRNPDQFGYGAIHFVVRLLGGAAKHDELANLTCEIQTRTVLQDAWAIIDHHLVYKNDANIPSELKRKLNRLAGNFESADEEFERIRNQRQRYLDKIERSKTSAEQFLENELNLDTFIEYAEWKFSACDGKSNEAEDAPIIRSILDAELYATLRQLDERVEKARANIAKIKNADGTPYAPSSAAEFVFLALVIADAEFRKRSHKENTFASMRELFVD